MEPVNLSLVTTAGIPAFHVMAKPTGAQCNLECEYCFYLRKDGLYPNSNFRMSIDTLEAFIFQTIQAHRVPEVTFSWQGGEPTLMGLDFFRRAVQMENQFAKPGMRIENTFQTNGVLVDEEWCRFFYENDFLVGLSLDGPRLLHDAYRHDKSGRSVFDSVVRAAKLLKKHSVRLNILCTVNAVNCLHPHDVYRFFRDEIGVLYIQFIPIVEPCHETGAGQAARMSDHTVDPERYGRFLNDIFDEWMRCDVGSVFILFFESVLASYLNAGSTLCLLSPICGEAVALEHTGDVYSCDHFVEPRFFLGNIHREPMADLVSSEMQRRFGRAKSETLPVRCRECRFLFTCFGECPKNRVLISPEGEPGLNWLCAGLQAFFEHVDVPMRSMAKLLRQGRSAVEIMNA